jgi:hypothetical protein
MGRAAHIIRERANAKSEKIRRLPPGKEYVVFSEKIGTHDNLQYCPFGIDWACSEITFRKHIHRQPKVREFFLRPP